MFSETLLSHLPLGSLFVGENIEDGLPRPFALSLLITFMTVPTVLNGTEI